MGHFAAVIATALAVDSATAQIYPSKLVEIAGDHTKCCGGVDAESGTLVGGYPLEDGDRLGRCSAAIGDLDGDEANCEISCHINSRTGR